MDFLPFIETTRDFPKDGVVFFDFTPLHEDPEAFRLAVSTLANEAASYFPDVVVAVEAKGFILGTALATALGVPLVLARKEGLTPGRVLREEFVKEYGFGVYEMKDGVLTPGQRVLVVYDIMAGPGASRAVFNLVENQGATVAAAAYVIELEYLGGRELLDEVPLISLVKVKEKP
jgi:adenine phosphoribosyltransferase